MTTKEASKLKVGDSLLARNGKPIKNDYRKGHAIVVVDVKPDSNSAKIQIFLSWCNDRSDKNMQAFPAKFKRNEIITIQD